MQEILIAKGVEILAPVIVPVITGLVSWGLYEFAKFVRTKTKNDTVNDAVSHICHTVETTVKDLEQSAVPVLKAKASDGKLSKQDAQAVKDIAMRRINKQVPDALAKIALKAVNDMQAFISAKIEKAVLELKK